MLDWSKVSSQNQHSIEKNYSTLIKEMNKIPLKLPKIPKKVSYSLDG